MQPPFQALLLVVAGLGIISAPLIYFALDRQLHPEKNRLSAMLVLYLPMLLASVGIIIQLWNQP